MLILNLKIIYYELTEHKGNLYLTSLAGGVYQNIIILQNTGSQECQSFMTNFRTINTGDTGEAFVQLWGNYAVWHQKETASSG